MLAQVLLTPTESKKFIAKAVAKLDEVQSALKNGIIALHPSTSTSFMLKELGEKVPETGVFVCGVNSPKGAYGSVESAASPGRDPHSHAEGVAGFRHTWVLEKGKLKLGMLLGDILEGMGPNDIYIKGVNAIDPYNTVGVLQAAKVEGGTIALVMSRSKHNGFKVVFPVGLEKLIPVPMQQAHEAAATRNSLNYCMGRPCTLMPCKEGIVVTELKAVEILSGGATATPISAGGLAGAEGAITMVIKGDDEPVTKVIHYIEECKGAKLPREVRVLEDFAVWGDHGPWR